MKYSFLRSIALIALLSAPHIVAANTLTTDEAKKVISSNVAKAAMNVVTPTVNSKALYDFTKLKSAQTFMSNQQNAKPPSGGLTGGSGGPRALGLNASIAQ